MRVFLTMLAAAGVLLAANAAARAAGFRYGARTGVNLTTFGGDFADFVGFRNQTGFTGGAMAEVPGTGPVRLRIDAVYSRKGAADHGSFLTDSIGNVVVGGKSDHWQLDYFEVPVQVELSGERGRTRAYLLACPSWGFALGGHVSSSFAGADQKLAYLRPVDVGLAGGVGVEFATAGPSLGLELRYTHGLQDLYDLENNLSSINRAWSFTMTV